MSQILEHWEYLHAHPEPSWQEQATAEWLAARCREAGLEPKFFGDIPGFTVDIGPQPARIGLRADMDCLEHDTASGTIRAHSCGHDANMAIVLDTVLALAAAPPSVGVRAIFQPAEERGNGAEHLAKRGVADELAVLFGVHLRPKPELRTGRFSPALRHSGCAFARVRITGPDVHGARPHQGNNAAETAADITVAVRGVRANPLVPHSAKVTWIRAGTGILNVIPGSCELGIDVRAAETAVLDELQEEIERRCRSIADAAGTTLEMSWEDVVPAALVGARAEALLEEAILETQGAEALVPSGPTPGSDDFHCYTVHRPELEAAMLAVGADLTPGLHDPSMTFDRSVLGPASQVLQHAVKLAARDLAAGDTW